MSSTTEEHRRMIKLNFLYSELAFQPVEEMIKTSGFFPKKGSSSFMLQSFRILEDEGILQSSTILLFYSVELQFR